MRIEGEIAVPPWPGKVEPERTLSTAQAVVEQALRKEHPLLWLRDWARRNPAAQDDMLVVVDDIARWLGLRRRRVVRAIAPYRRAFVHRLDMVQVAEVVRGKQRLVDRLRSVDVTLLVPPFQPGHRHRVRLEPLMPDVELKLRSNAARKPRNEEARAKQEREQLKIITDAILPSAIKLVTPGADA